jgi:hypothetical protein
MWYGFHLYDSIQVCDDEIMDASLGLMVYQMFNLCCFSVLVDFCWSWFYLEMQDDVDTITKFKRGPPKKKEAKGSSGKKDAFGNALEKDPLEADGGMPGFLDMKDPHDDESGTANSIAHPLAHSMLIFPQKKTALPPK